MSKIIEYTNLLHHYNSSTADEVLSFRLKHEDDELFQRRADTLDHLLKVRKTRTIPEYGEYQEWNDQFPSKYFFMHDGASTHANSAQLSLTYWLSGMRRFYDEDKTSLLPGPGDDNLLPFCIQMAKRRFDTEPDLVGNSLEEQAFSFLKWMHVFGNIDELRVDGELM